MITLFPRSRHLFSCLLLTSASLLGMSCSSGHETRSAAADVRFQDAGEDAETEPRIIIESVEPAQGFVEGGLTVVVRGSGFEEGATVRFGHVDAPQASVSSSRIDTTTPVYRGSGRVDVTVTNPDGGEATLSEAFHFVGRRPPSALGSCMLARPSTLEAMVDVESDPAFGRVYAENCTEGLASCAAVDGEFGWGDLAKDPSQEPQAWTWIHADFNGDHVTGDEDEFRTTFTPAEEGEFGYVYRFKLDTETSWTYCDLDGSQNGFQPEQAGRVSVVPYRPTGPKCRLVSPASITTEVGAAGERVFGEVLVDGCAHEPEDFCLPMVAELGSGPDDIDPSASPQAYTWRRAFASFDQAWGPDRYEATLSVDLPGSYAYLFRFSQDGETWSYCDLGDPLDGFSPERMGALTVVP